VKFSADSLVHRSSREAIARTDRMIATIVSRGNNDSVQASGYAQKTRIKFELATNNL
jgi:hypothetical protein